MPEPMTPERVAAMAGEPADPLAGLPQGLSGDGIRAANEQMFEGYMRERFGPVSVPPLHRGHNNPIQPATTSVATISGYDRTKDHQGSIREMLDASGNIVAEYSYDPYGRQTRIAGAGPDTDFAYAGYYVHQRSGLNLTRTRAYSPALGRFINRDSIGEAGGDNLYAYVANNPINWVDPEGTSFADGGGGELGFSPMSRLGPDPPPVGGGCWDQCKGKFPMLGPLLVASGLPILSTGAKIGGGSTPGTSLLSSALRGSPIDIGIPSTWAPTWGNPASTTGSLGGLLGRWAPIIGAAMTAKEYADFLCCIQSCINKSSGGNPCNKSCGK
jgi:RHS repeat-associated protein